MPKALTSCIRGRKVLVSRDVAGPTLRYGFEFSHPFCSGHTRQLDEGQRLSTNLYSEDRVRCVCGDRDRKGSLRLA